MNLSCLSMTLTLAMPPIGSEGPLECAVQVFSREAWFEAAGEVITLPFADLWDGTLVYVTDQYQDDGVLFTDGNDWIHYLPTFYLQDGVGLNGFEETITIEFDPPIYWAAVDLKECDELWLYSGDQLILATEDCFGSDYAGVGSTVSIDKLIIYDNPGCPCIDDFHFTRTPVTIDCNGNGVADLIEVGCGAAPDCNGNLIPDVCDLASALSEDCDGNGVLDECETAQLHTAYDDFSPFGTPIPLPLEFFDQPLAASDVLVTISATGDLDESFEVIIAVEFDDVVVAEFLFADDGLHCADPPQETSFTITAEQLNAALADDGDVLVEVRASSAVDPWECPASFVAAELAYLTFAETDLDFDGIPDVCEGAPGDVDGDGDVDFTDLLALIAAWGDCPPAEYCPADIDLSGSVGFDDLLLLLSNWS